MQESEVASLTDRVEITRLIAIKRTKIDEEYLAIEQWQVWEDETKDETFIEDYSHEKDDCINNIHILENEITALEIQRCNLKEAKPTTSIIRPKRIVISTITY